MSRCCKFWLLSLAGIAALMGPAHAATPVTASGAAPNLTVLPGGGRTLFAEAFAAAKREIRIEICVLEDVGILSDIQAALRRGVRVRAIVDQGKYLTNAEEQAHLATYLTGAGGELHLSNRIFPRSFPKVILVDDREFLVGSACLDETTFLAYRDFAFRSRSASELRELSRLFENDWAYSAPPGVEAPPFNPTPRLKAANLMVAPVNAAARMVSLYQSARKTLDVYTELLGNPTLQSELVSAVSRGVRVRLIAPVSVNNADEATRELQATALGQLKAAGVDVHVSGPAFDAAHPYMHARAAIVDQQKVFLGSISLSPDSITFNREVGLLLTDTAAKRAIARQFDFDFAHCTHAYAPGAMAVSAAAPGDAVCGQ